MTAKANTKKNQETSVENEDLPKTCFVIMPIADHPNYEPGHFKRVYDHLIAPACILAGYEPFRADDDSSSNMIMHGILLKIIKSDMVICDLSTNNANVFYELGLRQAFNKKTVLITDGREKTPFDLLGFRYQNYTSTLRIDTVTVEMERISTAITSTEAMPPNEVNSIVKLLEIDSANLEIVQPNENQAFMLQMFNSLSAQISNLNQRNNRDVLSIVREGSSTLTVNENDNQTPTMSFLQIEQENKAALSDFRFFYRSKNIGRFMNYTAEGTELRFRFANINTRLPNTESTKSIIFGHRI